MTDNQRPMPNPVIQLREEADDWAFLYNPDTNESFGVNPTGVLIWKLIDGKRTLEEIASACKGSCANVPADITQQIASFIQVLIQRHMVEIKA